jgi:outer membrane receptor protein involved in Fe transport
LLFTNHPDAAGNPTPFDTPNGLVSPGGEWHVEKPLTAFQDQIQLTKAIGRHNVALGLYGATYTQDNRWYFTDILTDIRDQPRFLDVIAVSGADTVHVTQNGFRRFLSNYTNGTGQASIFSAVLGGSIQLLERLRADLGARYEYNNFVQSSENTSTVDLDGDTLTKYDIEPFGNGSFRHFDRSLDDWSGTIGLNYTLTDQISLYGAGSRGYKMPALDEFLNAQAEAQVRLFDSRRTYTGEVGVKYATPRFGATVNGFYAELKNVTGQGAVTDPVTGGTIWIITSNPEVKSYGTEVELSTSPIQGLNLLGSGTWLKAEYATCPDTTAGPSATPCPTGTEVGSILLGVPKVIGNF